MGDILSTMLECIRGGLSVIPIGADGSKSPAPVGNGKRYAWTAEKTKIASETKVRTWHRRAGELKIEIGYAVLGGVVSGNLTIIDVDAEQLYSPWSFHVESERPGLLDRLPRIKTPNGYHIYFRTASPPAGNTKLAVGDKTLIETRGEGGYVLGPGSPPACHPSCKTYEYETGSLPITQTPVISEEDRDVLFGAARALGQVKESAVRGDSPTHSGAADLPGTDFNARGTWDDVLPAAGWTVVRTSGAIRYWRRPGKTDGGSSATTGFCKAPDGRDLLHVFSSNAAPFQADKAYGLFAAYAMLHHAGDYKAAAAELRRRGYGGSSTKSEPSLPGDESLVFTVSGNQPDLMMMDELRKAAVINKLWESPPKDFDEAEETLMRAAFGDGWTHQQVADLMTAYRQRAGRPRGDADEYRKIMRRVLRQTSVTQAVRNLKTEASGGDIDDPTARERMLDYLSKALQCRVQRFFQHGRREDATYGATIDNVDVMLGKAADVLSMPSVRASLLTTTRAVLPMFKVADWHQIVARILAVCEVIDEEEHSPLSLIRDWLTDYVSRYSYYSDENYQNAVASNLPFQREGHWHVKIDALASWINQAKPRLGWSIPDVVRLLRQLGGEPVQVQSRRHRVVRRYWSIPIALLGESSTADEASDDDGADLEDVGIFS